MDWQTVSKDVIVPLLAIVSPLFATFVAYQVGRTSTYREALYTRRIDMYNEIINAAIIYREEVIIALREQDFKGRADAFKIMESTNAYKNLTEISMKYIVYMPKDIGKALIDFKLSYIHIRREEQKVLRNGHLQVEYKLIGGQPDEAYSELIQVIRKHIGTDKLSKQLIKQLS